MGVVNQPEPATLLPTETWGSLKRRVWACTAGIYWSCCHKACSCWPAAVGLCHGRAMGITGVQR